jgi:TM2 domain-containing membrane protein YozV
MSEFKIACPNCQQHLLCNESYRGVQFACPTCGATIKVPPLADPPPPAKLRIAAAAPAPVASREPQPHIPRRPYVPSRPRGKSWLTTFMLAWFLGGFGIDRFYTGRTGLGIGKLLTNAACGVWGLIDILLLLFGRYRDAEGNSLQPAKRGHYFIALSVVAATVLAVVIAAAGMVNSVKSQVAGISSTADRIRCMNNLKQVGLAFRIWAMDHGDRFPFNVPAAQGGTREYCRRAADGFDTNAFRHFQLISNSLSMIQGESITPAVLICPADMSKTPASDWESLSSANVTYLLRSGPEISDSNPNEVLARCPTHGITLYCDGRLEKEDKGN